MLCFRNIKVVVATKIVVKFVREVVVVLFVSVILVVVCNEINTDVSVWTVK